MENNSSLNKKQKDLKIKDYSKNKSIFKNKDYNIIKIEVESKHLKK